MRLNDNRTRAGQASPVVVLLAFGSHARVSDSLAAVRTHPAADLIDGSGTEVNARLVDVSFCIQATNGACT